MKSRTMVYLEPGDHRQLVQEARKQGVSLAELVRRLVRRYLHGLSGTTIDKEDFHSIIALGSSGRQDIATDHDRYLGSALRDEHSR